jgi:hypothetical protein
MSHIPADTQHLNYQGACLVIWQEAYDQSRMMLLLDAQGYKSMIQCQFTNNLSRLDIIMPQQATLVVVPIYNVITVTWVHCAESS